MIGSEEIFRVVVLFIIQAWRKFMDITNKKKGTAEKKSLFSSKMSLKLEKKEGWTDAKII